MECMRGQFLQAGSTEKLKAGNYECNDARTDYRNGTRERETSVARLLRGQRTGLRSRPPFQFTPVYGLNLAWRRHYPPDPLFFEEKGG